MQKLLALMFALVAPVATAADQPRDITGAGEKMLHRHLGKVVSLHGTLGPGVQGEILSDATREVAFYVVPDVPPGGFTLPNSWQRLYGRQVRVTGVLRFRKFPPFDGSQVPPSYYYMVLQQTQIQPIETK